MFRRSKPRYSLFPIALFYWGLSWWRNFFYNIGFFISRRVPTAVVSIGNISMGGTGKTPATIFTARQLVALGYSVCILSRGYRRRSTGTVLVSDKDTVLVSTEDAGDEPYLMACRLPGVPVLVDEERYRGAMALVDRFAPDVLVLDDAFQHRGIARDCDIVLLDTSAPAWTYKIFPFGELRESLDGLRRASLVIWSKSNLVERPREISQRVERLGVPQVSGRYDVLTQLVDLSTDKQVAVAALPKGKILAFCGIANPRQFYRTLCDLGLEPDTIQYFKDHHEYSKEDLNNLGDLARRGHRLVITTEKDAVKLDKAFISTWRVYAVQIHFALNREAREKLLAILGECLPPPSPVTGIARA